ncbi:MAG: DUF4412 domain-containing protein [Deltaproteobacteria bacterium]|nr:DUF4412 domain-containing protein [Candidatus Tharpella aukensis]
MDLKKRALSVALTTIFVISLGFMSSLQAAEYSADMETRSRGHVVIKGKFFIKGEQSRNEMTQGGRDVIMISRLDKGVVWTLMPQEKSYMEMAIDLNDNEIMPDNWKTLLEKEGKKLGSETVNGVNCNKYEITDEGEKVTYWIAKNEGMAVRIVTTETEVNFRNIRTGKQPDHLFQIPTGYRKFAMPQIPGMQGMPGMQEGGNMPAFPNPR